MTVQELIAAAKKKQVTPEDIARLQQRVKTMEEEFAKRESTRKPSVALLNKPFASL